MTSNQPSRPRQAVLAAFGALVVVAVAACSTGTPGGSAAPAATVLAATAAPASQPPTAAPTVAQSAVVRAGPTGTAVPTTIDPCQLFTAQQASQLTGVTYSAGKSKTTEGNARVCTYGAASLHVFNVDVAVAPDVATAQAARAQAQAQMSQADPGLHVAQVSGIGDNAATAEGSMDLNGKALSVSGVYVLKGRIFFSLNDVSLGTPAAPSVDALEAAARTIVGQLP